MGEGAWRSEVRRFLGRGRSSIGQSPAFGHGRRDALWQAVGVSSPAGSPDRGTDARRAVHVLSTDTPVVPVYRTSVRVVPESTITIRHRLHPTALGPVRGRGPVGRDSDPVEARGRGRGRGRDRVLVGSRTDPSTSRASSASTAPDRPRRSTSCSLRTSPVPDANQRGSPGRDRRNRRLNVLQCQRTPRRHAHSPSPRPRSGRRLGRLRRPARTPTAADSARADHPPGPRAPRTNPRCRAPHRHRPGRRRRGRPRPASACACAGAPVDAVRFETGWADRSALDDHRSLGSQISRWEGTWHPPLCGRCQEFRLAALS